ncbi:MULTISPECIES: NAD(P)/FAD-dependent oxidoreductase [Nocardia]|uniref:NADH:ubiquinone reductase (non-electrogenic) n=2 Tax=Nocardia farcinica TaxID=37329 RepID=Q5YRR6_NOCFA|nr:MULTISPECIES: NAD(P)/FAD-dependent oxidoreductase [Nocardia]MBF6072344.1 NAD(P)/FAD-dependent oxidoreductase [Nocardia farcinica]MBF6141460.1 NAD(P)/FAD-dependent oxidoreductase [Nocardia farcinica]MBF6185260.1 NAD(P)/FAD-dependent oxidoreductase [Nocardia farcinica]MBF6230329.1 NAD(P)/FAD-dependent oxidoreductase [Nocardia farcinica]MBF6267058.1 NAD(P)/FAD-dependent oxidoreductase [Nocardia farcinica]
MDNVAVVEATGIEYSDVVIVGSGFGGLAAAKQLAKSNVDYVLISSTPEHLFQPLLYQVATGVLAAEEIAPPIAKILRRHDTADVRQGTVVAIEPDTAVLTYRTPGGELRRIRYGSLIAATGASQSYFGRDDFAEKTYSLKTIEDAKLLRAQIERVFTEAATADEATRQRLLSFVVVGAGATGVEVAGQLTELAKRHFHQEVSVTLVEGAGAVLPPFGGGLSEYAKKSLAKGGVEVLLDTFVTDIEPGKVTVKDKAGVERKIAAETVVWSAGVQAGGFAEILAEATGVETDRAGRLLINPDLTVGGYADIYAIGDMTSLNGYPGQSPVAMQEGRHAADIIRRKKQPGTPFVYWDKGSMAVISRFSAVAKLNEHITFRGVIAWFMWLAVHLFYLVGFRNRFAAVASWLVAFIGTGRPGFDEVDRTVEEPGRERVAA